MTQPTSVTLLREAVRIQEERGQTYNGNDQPERSFERIATVVNTKTGLNLSAANIALVLAELKYVRFESGVAAGVVHADSLLDYVSYNSLWAELAAIEATAKITAIEEMERSLKPLYASPHDEQLYKAAEAMQHLAKCREQINEAIPEGSTSALATYSRAVKALNEVSKSNQEKLFGSSVTDLMSGEITDATDDLTTSSD